MIPMKTQYYIFIWLSCYTVEIASNVKNGKLKVCRLPLFSMVAHINVVMGQIVVDVQQDCLDE